MIKKLKDQRTIGGILLVAGTTIGAGMLALPVITSFAGFIPSILIFAFIWLTMLFTSYLFLDVNLAIRGEPNLITMASKTLGKAGKFFSWVVYLLLLYSLTAAYIAGSTPLFQQAFATLAGLKIPSSLAAFVLPLVFGSFLWFGTTGIDYLNRCLMFGLLLAYGLLASFIPSEMQARFLERMELGSSLVAIPVILTSFGYHIIIPSLTTYLEHDRKRLRLVLLWGSIIPIFFYISWQLLVLGSVPFEMLKNAWIQGSSASIPLAQHLKSPWISIASSAFSFFAIITSFLGVSLSLSDFLADGLKIKKNGKGKLLAYALTFIPPITFVFTYQRGFYIALEYAGVCVAILLILLPALMAWKLKEHKLYQSKKGKVLLSGIVLISFLLIALDILLKKGYFQPLYT